MHGLLISAMRMPAMWLFCLWALAIAAGPALCQNECSACHSDSALTMEKPQGAPISIYVNEQRFSQSVHGSFSCTDCHVDIELESHPGEKSQAVKCSPCHEEVEEQFRFSLHGQSLQKGVEDAPACVDCHGYHFILAEDDSASNMYPANLVQMCARCHADHLTAERNPRPGPYSIEAYRNGTHFRALTQRHIHDAATCNDCHGSHTLKATNDPQSPVYRLRIPETCGSCHPEVEQDYAKGVHAKAVLAGAADAPVCVDCHGEHVYRQPWKEGRLLYRGDPGTGDCIWCHSSERIIAKYGLTPGIVDSYLEDFHGLAARCGDRKVATCGDCHGVHGITSFQDPQSPVHKQNLSATCGRCHPGVGAKVAAGSIHLLPSPRRDRAIYYLSSLYVILIVGVIGGMALHNGLDLIKKASRKFKGVGEEETEWFEGIEYVRLTLNERIQHSVLFFSFLVLVITGFALKFPEAWWAAPFFQIGWASDARGLLHRLAGGLFLALVVYHIGYLIFTRRGCEQFRALLPGLQDAKDANQMFRYLAGLSKEKPKCGRYNYAEKAEYWALVWGTLVMGSTGLLLWFENAAMKLFPKMILDVATTVHYYEAILASLAIVAWHFYFVFFDPKVFPIKTTCLTGKISEEEMVTDHPLEYARLRRRDKKVQRPPQNMA